MYQVYCNDEKGINKWLSENYDIEIVNIQMSLNNDGECIMVVYKTNVK